MNISVMKDGNICYGIDYSKKKKCSKTDKITKEEFEGIKEGIAEYKDKVIYKHQFKKEEDKIFYLGKGNKKIDGANEFRELVTKKYIDIFKKGGYIELIDGEEKIVENLSIK